MKQHTKNYYKFFDYPLDPDFSPPSELSGKPANDIHHIDARKMGGSKDKDHIENLMALTREEHERYGDIKVYKNFLHKVHLHFMQYQTPYWTRPKFGKPDPAGFKDFAKPQKPRIL